ncbi:hypothetical protein [Parasynechococcus sp.]|uniref:hypothetical protein n=1 Tax=Parasynechococcus sp. TaxID=3101203 RepID=UPI003703CB35
MAGCQSKQPAAPANTPTPLVSSCLGDFRMDDLELMVERCDEAIEQTPDQADLHRDRALVLTLLGNQAKACEDVALALSRLKRSSQPVDPMLPHELQVRQSSCKQSRTMAGSD